MIDSNTHGYILSWFYVELIYLLCLSDLVTAWLAQVKPVVKPAGDLSYCCVHSDCTVSVSQQYSDSLM